MESTKVKVGRPQIDEITLRLWLNKLAPYLQSGMSVETACLETKLPFSTVYRKMKQLEWFSEEIEHFKAFKEIIYANINMKQLLDIHRKVMLGQELTTAEYQFLFWLGEHDKNLAVRYGRVEKVKVAETDQSQIKNKITEEELKEFIIRQDVQAMFA